MKARSFIHIVIAGFAFVLMTSASAHALSMDAGASMTGYFRSSWTSGHPDITTVPVIYFKTTTVNYSIDSGGVTGQFAWDGTGTQPDYTMDPDAEYAAHIGGASSSLAVGNMSFDPNGNGKDFMTWYVDVPSTGGTDTIHFDLISEIVVSKTTTGNTKNTTIYLLGYVYDEDGNWTSSLASLNLTISETVVGTNYGYSWAATWASPPADAPPGVPEPSSMLLLGVGLTLVSGAALLRKSRNQNVVLKL